MGLPADGTVQEVFVACFRDGGALQRAQPDRRGGFRAYLYGIVRNVARRFEDRQARRRPEPGARLDPDRLPADDSTLSRIFDRA